MSGAIWAIFTKDSTSLENQTLAVDERFPKTTGRPSENRLHAPQHSAQQSYESSVVASRPSGGCKDLNCTILEPEDGCRAKTAIAIAKPRSTSAHPFGPVNFPYPDRPYGDPDHW